MNRYSIPAILLIASVSFGSQADNMSIIHQNDWAHRVYPVMDVARSVSGVDALHEGMLIGADIIPFTGRGVLIAVVDGGIDPHHIAFTDSDGMTRVEEYVMTESAYESETGEFTAVHYTHDDLTDAPADMYCEGHGTHTASTAAGARLNPYYGVAPDARLLFTTMGEHLYDDEILYGISSSLSYAAEAGLPIVINLSLGSVVGPHDGSGMISSLLSEDMSAGQIVCFSAGNDGNPNGSNVSLRRDFSVMSNPLSSFFGRKNYGTPPEDAYMQIWSADTRRHEICIHVVDLQTREVVLTTPYYNLDTNPELSEVVTLLDSTAPETSLIPQLDEYFDGTVLLAAQEMTHNSKYLTEFLASFEGVDTETRYSIGFSVKSDVGVDVLLTANASTCFFKNFGIDSFVMGNSQNSISDYCTSPYVVAVGAWNARSDWNDTFGNIHFLNEDYYGAYGDVAAYSSYGSLFGTGDEMVSFPHVVAPGTEIVAAVTSDQVGYADTVVADESGYFWGTKTGTSMSCPFAAGVIALWLEAKPDLTRDQVIEVINHSSCKDSFTQSAGIKAGAGKIDAYEGLKYIYTQFLSVDSSSLEFRPIVRHLSKSEMEIVLSYDEARGEAALYSLSGQLVSRKSFTGNTLRLSHNAVPGVYILTITSPNGYSSTRILMQ